MGQHEELQAKRRFWRAARARAQQLAPAKAGGEADFRGKPRSNQTHASTTDPDARLYKKAAGQAATLCHMGHVLTENRNGLVVEAELTLATGSAEREAACAMLDELEDEHRITVGADKAYDSRDFVADMRRLGVTPHVSQTTNGRRSAIDGRTTRHPCGWRSESA